MALAGGSLAGCDVGAYDEEVGDLEAPLGRDPVIWVHGCPPPPVNAEMVSHFTDAQRAYFAERGYPDDYLHRFVFSGAQCGSVIDVAAELADYVDAVRAQTRASRVDVVAHSLGAPAVRLYIAQGGDRYVRDFVSLAGANHGANAAGAGQILQDLFGAPAYEGLKEFFPPYACAGETTPGAAEIQPLLNGCLTADGRTDDVDETPNGGVDYLSIRNTEDEEITPNESACLNQSFQNDCSDPVNVAVTVPPGPGPCGPNGCPAHVTMLWDPGVMEMVYRHLSNPDDGDDVVDPNDPNDDDSD